MKKFVALLMVMVLGMCMLTGCTESDQVSYNISKEANNFNVTRKLTVINARTDTVLLEMIGTFSLSNNSTNELEIICEVVTVSTKSTLLSENIRCMWWKIFLVRK